MDAITLQRAGLRRSRGNPYDNAKAESFMKTLKVEAVYPMAYETFQTSSSSFPTSLRGSTTKAGFIRCWDISARSSSRINTSGRLAKQQIRVYPEGSLH